MKIHIIGGSGTGKSYMAGKLSKELGIPHYDLDNLMWDNTADTYGIKMPIEKRDAMLDEILSKDDWIMEGVYYKWCTKCFEEADRIYLLEIPRHTYVFRIIKRHIKRKLSIEKGKKESLKSLRDLLKWTKKFDQRNLVEIKEMLKDYEEKVTFIESAKDMDQRRENNEIRGNLSR